MKDEDQELTTDSGTTYWYEQAKHNLDILLYYLRGNSIFTCLCREASAEVQLLLCSCPVASRRN